jgi:hypothetical protein
VAEEDAEFLRSLDSGEKGRTIVVQAISRARRRQEEAEKSKPDCRDSGVKTKDLRESVGTDFVCGSLSGETCRYASEIAPRPQHERPEYRPAGSTGCGETGRCGAQRGDVLRFKLRPASASRRWGHKFTGGNPVAFSRSCPYYVCSSMIAFIFDSGGRQ